MAEGEAEEVVLEPVPPLSDEEFQAKLAQYEGLIKESGCDSNAVKKASLEEREKAEQLEQQALTYGEVDMDTLNQLLSMVKRDYGSLYKDHGIFLDLGSGCGKPCLAAALLHPFKKVVGVETIQCLNDYAGAISGKYGDMEVPEGATKTEVEFIKGNFVEEFADKIAPLAPEVTVALAVATCYGEPELQAMKSLAEQMPDGSIFITFTQMLPKTLVNHPKPEKFLKPAKGGWRMLYTDVRKTGWGQSSCYVFKKFAGPAKGNPFQFESGLQDCCTASPDLYTVVADMPSARLVQMKVPPGGESKLHEKPGYSNYFVTNSKLSITQFDKDGKQGETTEVEMAAASAPILPGSCHQVKNVGEEEAIAIFVEELPGAKPCGEISDYIAPFAAAPECYKILAENDTWITGEVNMQPGDMDKLHHHRDHLIYVLEGDEVTIYPDGDLDKGNAVPIKPFAGIPAPVSAGPIFARHIMKNTGTTPIKMIFFEMKT